MRKSMWWSMILIEVLDALSLSRGPVAKRQSSPKVLRINTEISRLGRQGRGVEALRLFKELGSDRDAYSYSAAILAAPSLKDATRIASAYNRMDVDSAAKAKVLNACLKRLKDSGKFEECLDFFENHMSVRDKISITTVIPLYGSHLKDAKRVLSLFRSLPEPDARAYASTVSALKHAGAPDKGLHLFELCPVSRRSAHLWSGALSCCQNGKQALALFQRIPPHFISKYAIHAALLACGTDLAEAETLLDIGLQRIKTEEYRVVSPTNKKKTRSHYQGHRRDQHNKINQASSDTETALLYYSAFFRICEANATRGDLVKARLKQCLLMTTTTGSNKHQIEQKEGERGNAFFHNTRLMKQQQQTWNAAMAALGASGLTREALALFRAMPSYAAPPNEASYATAIAALARSNTTSAWREALRILAAAPTKNAQTLGATLVCLERCGEAQVAAALLKSARDNHKAVDASCYHAAILAQRHLTKGSWRTALGLFRQMQRDGLPHTTRSYCALLEALVAQKRFEIADVCYAAARQRKLLDHSHRDGFTTVDLHGHSRATAVLALRAALADLSEYNRLSAENDDLKNSQDEPILTLVAGRGTRSASGRPVLREILQDMLQTSPETDNPGRFRLDAHKTQKLKQSLIALGGPFQGGSLASWPPIISHPALLLSYVLGQSLAKRSARAFLEENDEIFALDASSNASSLVEDELLSDLGEWSRNQEHQGDPLEESSYLCFDSLFASSSPPASLS